MRLSMEVQKSGYVTDDCVEKSADIRHFISP